MAVDVGWARTQLQSFIGLNELRREDVEVLHHPSGRTIRALDAMLDEVVQVEAVLDRITPGWREDVPTTTSDRWDRHIEACRRAVTLLDRRADMVERLGENAPLLDGAQLHPWVWQSARSLWNSRHYEQALLEALKSVNEQARLKAGRRDLSETKLFNELFSVQPPEPGRPRLRLTTDDGGDTYGSVHRGARALAEGLFAGVRNRHSHEVTDTPADEQRALEQLAAVSVLARWVDDAEVVTST